MRTAVVSLVACLLACHGDPTTDTTDTDTVSVATLALVDVMPPNGATEVALDAAVRVTFAEGVDIDPATVDDDTLFVYDPVSASKLVGTYDVDGHEVVFTPFAPLRRATELVGTVTPGLATLDGASLDETATWTFRTLPTVGELDPGFGSAGLVVTELSDACTVAYDMRVLPNDKVLVVGYSDQEGVNGPVLARFEPDGTLDASFAGGGVVELTLGPDNDAWLTAVDVDAQGAIVAAGTVLGSGSRQAGFVMRFMASGLPDASFGTGGVVVLPFAEEVVLYGVAAGDGGVVYASGDIIGGDARRGVIFAVDPEGAFVPEFGGGLPLELALGHGWDYLRDLVRDGDGNLLVGGGISIDVGGEVRAVPFVGRFTASGTLDESYQGGLSAFAMPGPAFVSTIALDRDGGLVLGIHEEGAGPPLRGSVARYTAEGLLDEGFGGTGLVQVGQGVHVRGVTEDADGAVIVGGWDESSVDHEALVARYHVDGTAAFVRRFGSSGTRRHLHGLGVQTTGRVVGAGSSRAAGPEGLMLIGVW